MYEMARLGTVRPIERSAANPDSHRKPVNLRHDMAPWQGGSEFSLGVSIDRLKLNDNCHEQYVLRMRRHCAILMGVSPPFFTPLTT